MIEYMSPVSLEQAWLPEKEAWAKSPGLLLRSYFIKYARKLETVFQFWTYSGV